MFLLDTVLMMWYNNYRKGTVAAVSAPLWKGVNIMSEVILLLTYVIVLITVKVVIDDIKKK